MIYKKNIWYYSRFLSSYFVEYLPRNVFEEVKKRMISNRFNLILSVKFAMEKQHLPC